MIPVENSNIYTISRFSTCNSNKNNEQDADFAPNPLPDVKQGDMLQCVDGQLAEKQTSPPKHFTDATLLAAMTGIARYVTDPEIKKILRETDGLGTEATRAGIIELLFKRQFLTKQGKEIRATEIGKKLINSLPERIVVPDMTAHWEAQLEAICEKRLRYNDFMLPLEDGLTALLTEVAGQKQRFTGLHGLGQNRFQKSKPTSRRVGSRKKTSKSTRPRQAG